jgi:hypothetical protein
MGCILKKSYSTGIPNNTVSDGVHVREGWHQHQPEALDHEQKKGLRKHYPDVSLRCILLCLIKNISWKYVKIKFKIIKIKKW